MAENSKIEWTNNTGGPWLVCSKVSPGCTHCYAEDLMARRLQVIVRKAYKAAGLADWETRPTWGDSAPRVLTKGFWNEVRARDRKAAKEGVRVRHFPSLIDWLDTMPAGILDQDGRWLNPVEVLADLLKAVHDCQHTDFLLLTKRPENWEERIDAAFEYSHGEGWQSLWTQDEAPANIWPGTTVESQQYVKRCADLLKIPAKVRFLSCEPLLGPITFLDTPTGWPFVDGHGNNQIHWLIAGGESGKGARPMHPDWARSLRDQCQAAGVPFFFKQWGEWAPSEQRSGEYWRLQKKDYLPWAGEFMVRVGKKAAGRLLDGKEWNEFPREAVVAQ